MGIDSLDRIEPGPDCVSEVLKAIEDSPLIGLAQRPAGAALYNLAANRVP